MDSPCAVWPTSSTSTPEDESWQDTLRRIADAMWPTALRSPAVCALTFARTTGGPAERRFVELVLDTFARAGLSREQTVRHYRAFVDTALGLVAQVATLTTLDPEVQSRDASAWTRIYARLPEEEYPTARAHVEELTSISRRSVYNAVIDALIAAAERDATGR